MSPKPVDFDAAFTTFADDPLVNDGELRRKKFKCDMCSVRGRMADYKAHMAEHYRNRPFKCEHCNKMFKTVTDVERHTNATHLRSVHKCTICEKNLYSDRDFKNHMRNHEIPEPFKCGFCDFIYADGKWLYIYFKR